MWLPLTVGRARVLLDGGQLWSQEAVWLWTVFLHFDPRSDRNENQESYFVSEHSYDLGTLTSNWIAVSATVGLKNKMIA